MTCRVAVSWDVEIVHFADEFSSARLTQSSPEVPGEDDQGNEQQGFPGHYICSVVRGEVLAHDQHAQANHAYAGPAKGRDRFFQG